MHWNAIERNWKDFKGRAKERWDRLTDGEIEAIAGRRDALCDALQRTYRISREEAERQIDEFGDTYEMDVLSGTERWR